MGLLLIAESSRGQIEPTDPLSVSSIFFFLFLYNVTRNSRVIFHTIVDHKVIRT